MVQIPAKCLVVRVKSAQLCLAVRVLSSGSPDLRVSQQNTENISNSSLTSKRWMKSHFMDLPLLNSMITIKVNDLNLGVTGDHLI